MMSLLTLDTDSIKLLYPVALVLFFVMFCQETDASKALLDNRRELGQSSLLTGLAYLLRVPFVLRRFGTAFSPQDVVETGVRVAVGRQVGVLGLIRHHVLVQRRHVLVGAGKAEVQQSGEDTEEEPPYEGGHLMRRGHPVVHV